MAHAKNFLVIGMLDQAPDEANWIRRRISAPVDVLSMSADRHLTKLFGTKLRKHLAHRLLQMLFAGGIIMKTLLPTVLGGLIGGVLLTLPVPSHAAFAGRSFNQSRLANDIRNDRNEIRQDREKLGSERSDLHQDREQLREDRRDGASHNEIANDRRDIREDRRDIIRDRRDLRGDRENLRDLERERQSWFDWRHWWWNHR